MRIDAVVFDMDGLMIDSEQVYAYASQQTEREMGHPSNGELSRMTMGMNKTAWLNTIRSYYGEDFDIEFFRNRSRELMQLWYDEHGIPVKKGLVELLTYLKQQKIPCAVATSTYREKATAQLKQVGVYDYFTGFVFGDMVEKSKPEPDIFLAAAALLGMEPTHCMGLEDSYNGLNASHAAGFYTVMVPDMAPATPAILDITDGCVQSLLDIIPLLERLNHSTVEEAVQ